MPPDFCDRSAADATRRQHALVRGWDVQVGQPSIPTAPFHKRICAFRWLRQTSTAGIRYDVRSKEKRLQDG